MDLALAILAWIAVALGALLLLLLVMPVQARAEGRLRDVEADGRLKVRWGFGFLTLAAEPGRSPEIRLLGLRVSRLRPSRPRKAEPETPEPRKPERPAPSVRAFWRHRRTLWHAGRRLLRTAHLRGRVEGAVGLAEPEGTAVLHGALATARATFGQPEIDVECDWVEDLIDLRGELRSLVVPAEVLGVGMALLLRRDVRKAIRDLRGANGEKEKRT
jgi:hypothetical protein